MDAAPEHILTSLGKAAENIPVFGALALSSSDQFADSYSFCGDKVLTDGVVLAAIFTKSPPSFYSVSVKYNRIMRLKDPITEAKGKTLLSIGGKTFKEYMETDSSGAGEDLPYLFYGSDGSEIVRVCHRITPEGYGLFTGEVPPDAMIAVCTGVSKEDIVETATELFSRIKEECGETSGCLIYSCMTRRFLLGPDKNVELWAIQNVLGDNKALSFSYSGGEVFPQTLKSGKMINQLQNNTLIVCVFHE
jgi:hypothetical protein